MKMRTTPIALVSIFLLGNLYASAQKLPAVQKASVYAPVGIKIDGRGTEWTGKYQAKNSATLLTYVMSNDDENLYLTIQAEGTAALGKIFHGGISLLVKNKVDKNAKPVRITYPLVTVTERSDIVIPLRDKDNNIDSVMIAVNQAIGKSAKKIAIEGIDEITDPDVSVYNDLGLKAAVEVDATRTMTFEYKVPLKYIKHLMDATSTFDYSIIVNGVKLEKNSVVVAGSAIGGGGASFSGGGGGGAPMSVTISPVGGDIFSPTDLKATYTLAKK
ncbi:hypothetical protein [Mucilaginibacter myungsuensis]|uniref:Uncharacterized protein n=1 Tax=Mucilaginibacter myungsuensis TaxID=649104 RepID=A0A929KVZ5_9SPHI|nr:hypothetical protein [Mucilaginibacter myungsuensis]MBE9661453.1 hypothetical protein [Mucilaginibacter myungsuensis]MDN3597596.1 hypothetical protein [Mucilaginibacter myungsuensis]